MQATKLKPIVARIILLLFVSFNYSSCINLHFHFSGNRSLIVHAHPFDENNNSPIKQADDPILTA